MTRRDRLVGVTLSDLENVVRWLDDDSRTDALYVAVRDLIASKAPELLLDGYQ